VRLSRPGEAPPFRGRRLALAWDVGRPVVTAEADDGLHAVRGPFVVATGANAPVRLAADVAQVPGAAEPRELLEDGVWLARLPALRFAGAVGLDVAAGLMRPQGGEAGVIGGQALAHFRLRFDFPRGALLVAPAR
jgi:hypothetical protein